MDRARKHRGQNHPQKLGIAGKAPDALVKPHKPEHHDAEPGINEDGIRIRQQIPGVYLAELAVKAYPQRSKIGCRHCQEVIKHQQD